MQSGAGAGTGFAPSDFSCPQTFCKDGRLAMFSQKITFKAALTGWQSVSTGARSGYAFVRETVPFEEEDLSAGCCKKKILTFLLVEEKM